MRIFVTGATGFIGSALLPLLQQAGHQVLGLARSEEAAQALTNAGAEVQRGSLDDLQSLRQGAAAAEGVIHLGFVHDFARFAAAAETDKRAIEALGDALAGTNRPLVTTAGVMGLNAPGRLATEHDMHLPLSPRVTDAVTQAQVAKGVRACVVRLAPLVHDSHYCGFVDMFIQAARQKGTAVYVGEGQNRWSAVHRLDTAQLFRLVLEQGVAGGTYHGVADEALSMRELMTQLGQGLGLPVVSKTPEEATAYLGPIAPFIALDGPASSALTQQVLGWQPNQPGLLADLAQGQYFSK